MEVQRHRAVAERARKAPVGETRTHASRAQSSLHERRRGRGPNGDRTPPFVGRALSVCTFEAAFTIMRFITLPSGTRCVDAVQCAILERTMTAPLLLSLLLASPAQVDPATGADASKVRVVLEETGNVGLRISDAQALATDVMNGLRKRMGEDAVVFEGTLAGNLKLKKLLGPNAESQIQDEQIAYLQAAMEKARFRVRLRFGKAKNEHFITLSCRNNGADPKSALEEKRFTGATFAKARQAMNEGLPSFCRIADPPSAAPPAPEPKKAKEWTLPPRRD